MRTGHEDLQQKGSCPAIVNFSNYMFKDACSKLAMTRTN